MATLTRAVVLAAGQGTRMQAPDREVSLTPEQEAAADRGLKTLIPIHGHPYIAYVLHELAEAGLTDVCLVVGPGDDPVRAAVTALPTRRLDIRFAVQAEPRGGADAVLASQTVVGTDPFVVINGDNIYPASVLRPLRDLDGPGLAAFDRDTLIRESNIPADRVAAFAVIRTEDGELAHIVEKPPAETLARMDDAPISMTCWRFDAAIYDACRDVTPSPRDELELPGAVALAIDRGTRFRVVPVRAGVLDISRRRDIPGVEARLRGREPRL